MNQYSIDELKEIKRKENLTWDELANLVNQIYDLDLSTEAIRSRIRRNVDFGVAVNNSKEDFDDYLLEIKKERFKLSDERAQINAQLRRLAREEVIKEIALDCANIMNNKLVLKSRDNILKNKKITKAGILCVSDVHYGLVVNSSLNKYNTDIAQLRLQTLLDNVIGYIQKENIQKLVVLNLGDLIAGRIHTSIRLQSRIDVVTQTMEISEILAQMLFELSNYIDVEYASTSDNHSRVEPIKSESLELESLIRITDWYLKERCRGFVTFIDNNISYDISTFKVFNWNIIATHGDKDKPNNVIQHLRLLTNSNYELCLMAHRHHFSADECCGTTLICNGSVCGTDQFAQDLRMHSKPSQNLIVLTENNPLECIYKINLD